MKKAVSTESWSLTMASIISPTEPPPDDDPEDTEEAIIENFEVFLLGPEEASEAQQENPYVRKLSEDSFLSILQPRRVKNAFQNEKERGLFQLFLSNSLFESMLRWTNVELTKKGKQQISLDKMMAYIGLEVAMSLIQMGDIAHYWSRSRFEGHHDFRETMSRTDFQTIRASIQFHPPLVYDAETATKDPLYHSRCFLNHFQKNCSAVAVPMGSSALDKASCRTSARTRAKTYLPNKPIIYHELWYPTMLPSWFGNIRRMAFSTQVPSWTRLPGPNLPYLHVT
jgi:hypothetical protein